MRTRTTVVVVTWRGREHVRDCLAALAAQERPHRTLVVDNASDDGTAELLAGHEVLRLPVNTGYAGGIAAALGQVRTEYLAWLNDDAAPEPGWLAALEDELDAHPDAAAVSSVLVDAGGAVTSAGTALDRDGYGLDLTGDAEPFGFCGGAVLLRTGALHAVGGVPAEFFCYYEDTDTAWRLRLAGYGIRHANEARARHRHGASTRPGSWRFHHWNERNRLFMLARCAPATVVGAQLAKFALLALKPGLPATPNFAPRLRLRVLGELLLAAPRLLAERRAVGRIARRGRARVWRAASSGAAARIGADARGDRID
ncbi:glycosyltransferase family 2 protein [Sciscionella sediminilitoris]|uniref:glycosyltransferase family 2 protein n=1 Tax=Sciscionella sediminilitoris TaxID=1445613 RepID=UPI000562CD57|nr:glycosyltransferase family 2 protein [Sciscionella sp. SE31]